MVLHSEIARWMAVAEQERLAELARRPHPRPVAAARLLRRWARTNSDGG